MIGRISRLQAVVLLIGTAVATHPAGADIIYATSFTSGELIRYDSADPAGTRTVLSPIGSLIRPTSVVIGPDGNLYIGENGDGATFAPRISKFDPSTLTLSTVIPFGGFDVFPGGLAFQGNDLLIGRNPFFGNTGPVVKLSNATDGPLALNDHTTGGSLASSPGFALAADGRLYVSDQTYNFSTGIASGPAKRFDADGTYIGELIADGTAGLAGPTGIAIHANTLFTASIMTGEILQTNLATDITTSFATTGSPFEAGTLALLSDASLLTGSPSGSGNIYHFGTDGTLLGIFASGLGQIGGIAAVPEPTTAGLVGIGITLGASLLRRRRRA